MEPGAQQRVDGFFRCARFKQLPPYWYSGAGVATIIWNGVLRRFSSARPLWQAPVPRTSGNRDARA